MLDPIAQQLGVGGSLFLTALWLLLKYKPWRDGNGKRQDSAGGRPVEFWMETIRDTIKDALDSSIAARNESVRRIIREELQTFKNRGGSTHGL